MGLTPDPAAERSRRSDANQLEPTGSGFVIAKGYFNGCTTRGERRFQMAGDRILQEPDRRMSPRAQRSAVNGGRFRGHRNRAVEYSAM